MSAAAGVLLVERLSKANAFSALLGGNWNVICISGSVAEPVFKGDVGQVDLAPRQRLQISPQLAEVRQRLRQFGTAVWIATDPTLMGELAAHFIATVLELVEPRKIDLYEVTGTGIAAATAHARRIDLQRIARHLREQQRSASIAHELSQQFNNIMGREDFVPGHTERILLGEIAGRERAIRLAGRGATEGPALHFDDWIAYPVGPRHAPEIAALGSVQPRQVMVRVKSCNTLAHPDPAPAAMDYCSLVRFANHRLGLGATTLQEHAYDLYLRGIVTFPFTGSTRLDSFGVRAACRLARSKRQPVRDETELLTARPRASKGMAIRPTDMRQESIDAPEVLQELYAAIHRRCLFSVLEPSAAKERRIVFELIEDGRPVLFEARSYTGMTHGWRAVAGSEYSVDGDDHSLQLPIINTGERFIAELGLAPLQTSISDRRLEESDLGTLFGEVGTSDCSEWFRALRVLNDAGYVRIREGVIMASSFGISVMRALIGNDVSETRSEHAASDADQALFAINR